MQADVERDAAQSRADELSLDLSAARREVAALRSQLARQQQDIIQLKMQLSQAAASAAAAAIAGGSGGGSRGGSLTQQGVGAAWFSGCCAGQQKGVAG